MRIPPSQRNVNERKYLYTFLENGDVPIDNDRAENVIRPFIACGNAVSTYTAQNLGAGKKERIREGYKASVLLCAGIAVIEFAVIMLLRRRFLGFFMDLSSSSSSAIETGMGYMTDLAFCYIIMGINSSFNGMLRGLGCLKLFLSGSIINLTFRIIFTYALVSVIGVSAVWLSMPAGWVLSFIYGRVGYRIMCKKKDSAGISDI